MKRISLLTTAATALVAFAVSACASGADEPIELPEDAELFSIENFDHPKVRDWLG